MLYTSQEETIATLNEYFLLYQGDGMWCAFMQTSLINDPWCLRKRIHWEGENIMSCSIVWEGLV